MIKIFGPIPSRRLGRSLGINNIPPKACSYACVYCQVGQVTTLPIEKERRQFYSPDEIFQQVKQRLTELQAQNETVDYLSFVPDGEPTLDVNLATTLDKLRPLGVKIAIITNGSLLWREEVRITLAKADWVSLKVDNVDETIWRQINQAHGQLKLEKILAGMRIFADTYTGTLVTETMLIKGLNTGETAAKGVAAFLAQLKPQIAYLLVPTRPTAEPHIYPPTPEEINRFYQIVSQQVPHVECLTQYEGNAVASTGDVVQDLLSITAVHPLRQEAVQALLAKNQTGWHVVDALIRDGQLRKTAYEGHTFYIRCF